MTFSDLIIALIPLKGGPRVYIEENCEKMTVTFYCHRKHISRVRKINWDNIRLAGVLFLFKTMSHDNLFSNCEGQTVWMRTLK